MLTLKFFSRAAAQPFFIEVDVLDTRIESYLDPVLPIPIRAVDENTRLIVLAERKPFERGGRSYGTTASADTIANSRGFKP